MATARARPVRDLRLDFFRGLALILIFIDHVPGNVLSYFTLRSIAFSDAAEAFIFISGFAAAMVYGSHLSQRGFVLATAQIYRRVWQLYVAHVFLFVIFTAEVSYALSAADNPLYAEEMGVGDFLNEPHIAIIQALLLRFQPTFLDILPLYIVMLLVFPIVLVLIEWNALAVLIPSAALYAVVQRFGWTPHTYPDNHPWFFNPLAWQFLFIVGAVCGRWRATERAILPKGKWLRTLAAAIAVFCAVINLSWLVHWIWDPFPPLLARYLWRFAIDKTNLSPVRLVDFAALAVVAVTVIDRNSKFLSGPIARPLVLCGQNSLYIFCLGILLAVLGHVVLSEITDALPMQALVNAAGIGVMIAMALLIAWFKEADRRPATASGPAQ